MHAYQEPSQATVPMNHLIIGQPTQNTAMAATSFYQSQHSGSIGQYNRSANLSSPVVAQGSAPEYK
jgi:hypothetical protein